MTEIQEQPSPKATTIIPQTHIWALLFWHKNCSFPSAMTSQDRDQLIGWVQYADYRDQDKPLKLYRLDY